MRAPPCRRAPVKPCRKAPHRAIVLGRYRRAGVGLALGAPGVAGCAGAGTWVLDVGR